jgi:hypothetical protein
MSAKVIVIESCKKCPFLGHKKKKNIYVCTALDDTLIAKLNSIAPNCPLDDVVIDKKHLSSPDVVMSEGTAICKSIPKNVSIQACLIGSEYHFQRQVDGIIRLYVYENEEQKYLRFPWKLFEANFRIIKEQSLNTDIFEICPRCGRIKRWCECL